MREHHALRLARRPRRINDRRQVLWLGALDHLIERTIMLLLRLRPFHQRTKALSTAKLPGIHHHYMLELRQVSCGRQLFVLLARRQHRHLRPRVPQHVSNLLRRQCRIQRDVHASNRQRRKVCHRPLPPVLRQDRHPISLCQTPSPKHVRQRPHPSIQLIRRNRLPHSVCIQPRHHHGITASRDHPQNIIQTAQIKHVISKVRFKIHIHRKFRCSDKLSPLVALISAQPMKPSSRPKAAHFAAAVERPPHFVFAGVRSSSKLKNSAILTEAAHSLIASSAMEKSASLPKT